MLVLSDLRAGYGSTPVLHGVNLSLAAGECAAVLGRNGVGKTTAELRRDRTLQRKYMAL